MDYIDGSYLAAVSLAGKAARALRRFTPPGLRLRLEAEPPADGALHGVPWIWLQAVSVGELILAEGVLRFLLENGHRVHVTTGTVAGLELLQSRLPAWDANRGLVTGGAFPVDDPKGLKPFFEHPPALFLALETEIWPNLLRELERHDVPRVIINGRLTAKSLSRGGPWMQKAASRLTFVAARDMASLMAFSQLGAPNVALGGNLKAAMAPPAKLHEGWETLRCAWEGCPVLVVGNTVSGEESLCLNAWIKARSVFGDLKLIVAPRQPRRFQEVADLLETMELCFARASMTWSAHVDAWRALDILLLDTLGELGSAYGEGTLALVGGGWTWHGGHNPLEPVRWGLPTLIGPGYKNFADLVDPLLEVGLLQVVESDSLGEALVAKLDGAPLRPGKQEKKVDLPPSLRGTLERSCELIRKYLPRK